MFRKSKKVIAVFLSCAIAILMLPSVSLQPVVVGGAYQDSIINEYWLPQLYLYVDAVNEMDEDTFNYIYVYFQNYGDSSIKDVKFSMTIPSELEFVDNIAKRNIYGK